jgi:hypothetical protein
MLALADPAMRSSARTRAKAYPPKAGAATAVAATVEDALEQLKAAYERYDAEKMPAAQYLDTWEVFKVQLVTAITRVSKEAIATVNRSYKCKVARLRRRMREPGKPHAQIQSMQRELLATVTKWQGLKRRKLMVEQADRSTEATRAFFQRVAIPRAAQVVTSIRATEGAPARALDDLANKMADGWMGVFTKPERPPRPALYEDLRTPKLDETTRSSLAAPFTSDEIRASLRRCKRTKSAGPDRLPNAWYRDYEDELVPVLAKLFNICHEHDVFPSSFTSATIVCLPKAGKTDNPLGYRPIALLNTDYKVFMRLLATRLKPALPNMIAPSQGGFVPGRDIHNVIDLFAGAQRHATETDAETVAVLLDIQKAYDSLDRTFLYECLEQRGFPAAFTRAI